MSPKDKGKCISCEHGNASLRIEAVDANRSAGGVQAMSGKKYAFFTVQ